MSMETNVILKQLLLQVLQADDLESAQDAVKFLCTKEEVAEAEKIAAKMRMKHSK
jgi:hypothetical protein